MKFAIAFNSALPYRKPMENSVPNDPHKKVSETLGLWEPKRTLTLEAARKHSERVRLFRLALLGVAGLIVIGLIWQFATQQSSFIVDDNPDESVKMINPRYSGRTKDGLPYKLTSAAAVRLTQNAEEVALESPVLTFMRTLDAAPSTVTALTGRYNDMTQILDLETNVDLKTDDGYNCLTTEAKIFAGDKKIEGDAPINCSGNFGRVSGQSYEILDDYKEFVFKGGTTALLTQKDNRPAPASGESDPLNFGFAGNGPIDVVATEGTYKQGVTVLNGAVVVKQGTAIIQSNEMFIYRETASSGAKGSLRLGAVREIDAIGDFKYTSPDNVVTGDRGVYDQETGVVTVTGKVTATQPSGNVIRSERLTYNPKDKTIRFDNKCMGENCDTRTRMRLLPQ